MADDSKIKSEEKLVQLIKEKAEALADLVNKQKEYVKGTEAYESIAKKIEMVRDQLRKLKNQLPQSLQLEQLAKDGGDALTDLIGKVGGVASGIGKSIKPVFEGLMGTIKSNADLGFAVMSQGMRDAANPLAEAGTIINNIPVVGEKVFAPMNEMLSNLAKTQTTVREAFIRTGKSIEEADVGAKEYPQNLRRMAVATGISTKALDEMNRSLSFLGADALTPASKGLSDITGAIDGGLTPISTFATVARGMGMSTQEAVSSMSEAFMRFRQQPLDAARSLGVMAAAAKATDQDLGLTHKAIVDASSSLGIFGQKSDAAAGVWTTFMRTLKDTVPIGQVNGMVKQLSDGLANMSVQNRSFITMMSGMMQGSTALGGGLKMELEMRGPGGLEKHLQSLTDSLSRFGGGQVITLEQAANDPNLQAQFQVQRQMLGQLTGIRGEAEQNRVLEVLQGVQTGGISQVEGSKALQNAFKGGQTIQEKQLSVLERIDRSLQVQLGGKLDERLNMMNEIGGITELEDLLRLGTMTERGTELGDEKSVGLMQRYMHNVTQLAGKFDDESKMSRSNLKGAPKLIEGIRRGASGELGPQSQTVDLSPAMLPTQANVIPTLDMKRRSDTYPEDISRDMRAMSSEVVSLRSEPIPNAFNQAAGNISGGAKTQVDVKDVGESIIQVKISGDRSLSRDNLKQIKDVIKDALSDFGQKTSGTSVRAPHNGA